MFHVCRCNKCRGRLESPDRCRLVCAGLRMVVVRWLIVCQHWYRPGEVPVKKEVKAADVTPESSRSPTCQIDVCGQMRGVLSAPYKPVCVKSQVRSAEIVVHGHVADIRRARHCKPLADTASSLPSGEDCQGGFRSARRAFAGHLPRCHAHARGQSRRFAILVVAIVLSLRASILERPPGNAQMELQTEPSETETLVSNTRGNLYSKCTCILLSRRSPG